MKGIFEVVSAGMQTKEFNGKITNKLAIIQEAEMKTAKVEGAVLTECKNLPLYKPVTLELEISDGEMNGRRYVSYKVVRIVSSENKK